MKKRNNLFREILVWTYKKQEVGFLEEDLKKELDLTKEQFNWYLKTFRSDFPENENLIRYLKYVEQENKHLFILTAKGISKYFEFKKSWHEKPIGKMIFILIGAVIGLLVKEFWNYVLLIFGK